MTLTSGLAGFPTASRCRVGGSGMQSHYAKLTRKKGQTAPLRGVFVEATIMHRWIS